MSTPVFMVVYNPPTRRRFRPGLTSTKRFDEKRFTYGKAKREIPDIEVKPERLDLV